MGLIKTTGNCGLVIDASGHGDRRLREPEGHFILNRYRVDDDGHVCLTPSLPLPALLGSIEVLKAELESLLEQAEQQFRMAGRAH